MKKILLLASVLILLQNYAFSQQLSLVNKPFSFQIGVHANHWQPTKKIHYQAEPKTESNSFGMVLRGLYRFKLNKSNTVGLQAGLGISNYNFSTNVERWTYAHPGGDFPFTYLNSNDYKRNKLALTYLDIPIELSVKAPKGLKFTLGFSGGWLINAHTKTVFNKTPAETVKVKSRDPFNNFRYGPEVRIGYKKLSLYAKYDLNSSLSPEAFSDGYKVIAFGLMFSRY